MSDDSGSRSFFSGNSLEQAVMAAARHFDLDPDAVLYERIERRGGVLRGRRRIVIKVDPENPRRDPRAQTESTPPEPARSQPAERAEARPALAPRPGGRDATPPPARQRDDDQAATQSQPRARKPWHERDEEPQEDFPAGGRSRGEQRSHGGRDRARGGRSHDDDRVLFEPVDPVVDEPVDRGLPVAEGEEADAALEIVQTLVRVAGLDLEVEVLEGEDQLEVEISGADQPQVVEREGKVLEALQHLLPRALHNQFGRPVPCRIDSHDYRAQRVQSLEELASRVADEVRREGRPQTLNTLSPADRRTVHMALQDEEDLVTESSGDGFFKRITVRPV